MNHLYNTSKVVSLWYQGIDEFTQNKKKPNPENKLNQTTNTQKP